MTVVATTAEWLCTRCGSTNRRLVPRTTGEVVDRCLHCHERHVVTRGKRPVRWEARPKD
jgi:DNA-directed RNA polymerase subunit RPC12/RpoP